MSEKSYTEGTWKGRPNYECTICPRADLDLNHLKKVQLKDCPKPACPGKPKTRERATPFVAPSGQPLTITEPTKPRDDQRGITNFFPDNKEATTHG